MPVPSTSWPSTAPSRRHRRFPTPRGPGPRTQPPRPGSLSPGAATWDGRARGAGRNGWLTGPAPAAHNGRAGALPGPAPFFSQWLPIPNAEMNCVPASVAMILAKLDPARARAFGSDPRGGFHARHLVHKLSTWMVQRQGGRIGLVDYRILALMLHELGLRAGGGDGLNLQGLRLALAQGHQAILLGDGKALPHASARSRSVAALTDSLHAVVVTAQDPRTGHFLVNDPAHPDGRPVWMTGGQLQAFVHYVNRDIDGTGRGSTIYVG